MGGLASDVYPAGLIQFRCRRVFCLVSQFPHLLTY
jgi:hypothetical protein